MNADALSRSDHSDESTKKENEEYQRQWSIWELKITFATDLKGDPAEIAKEKWRLPGYSPAAHSISQKQDMRS